MNNASLRHILLLEDNDDDAFLTERALKKAGINSMLQRYYDGQSVIDHLSTLRREDDLIKNTIPHLVLLDIKTPKKTGLEVLHWIRSHQQFAPMIVLALTSSSERKDIARAFELHINAYLVKPTSLSTMVEIAQCIKKLWLDNFDLTRCA
jgi:CheY-like chemotaxis protein